MKNYSAIACLAAICIAPLHAADLSIELPKAQWLLPPLSPLFGQRESQLLPPEQKLSAKLVPLLQQNRFEEALALLREEHADLMTTLEAGDPDNTAYISISNGTPIQFNRPSAALLYMMGHVYFSLQQMVPAEKVFLAILTVVPDYMRVHESLGILYLETERFREARVHLSRAAALGLNTPALYGALGYLNQQTENWWGAASAYQQAIMLDSDNDQWQQGLLYSLTQTHQYDSALTYIDQLLQKHADDSTLWLFRSYIAEQLNDQRSELSSLETAIRLGDDSVANLQVCASLHMQIGSIARAVELLQKGMLENLDIVFAEQAAQWLMQKDEWDHVPGLLGSMRTRWDTLATKDQSKLLTLEANYSQNQHKTAEARTALQKALELDPGNADALMALGDIFIASKNYGQAELLFTRATAYVAYRENAWLSLAQIAIDQGNYTRGLDLLQQVVASNPGRTDLRRNIDSLENLALLQSGN